MMGALPLEETLIKFPGRKSWFENIKEWLNVSFLVESKMGVW
jgi:hypothetical protein